MLIQRRITTLYQRRITTFKQPFIDVVYGYSDVDTTLSRRCNETLEQRRVSTSHQHFYCDCIAASFRLRNSTLERRLCVYWDEALIDNYEKVSFALVMYVLLNQVAFFISYKEFMR